MDIKTIKQIVPNLPAEIAVLMRGPTGVGKSHVAAKISEELGYPFIDVRGSTMQEGDVIGYPDLEAMKTSGVSTMVLPAWFMRACKEPCVLMLDELNRALPGVMQGFFQVVLDRHLGNDKDGMPIALHPDTRVIAAVNAGNEYDVNDMDPALLRRLSATEPIPDAMGHRISLHLLSRQGDQRPGPQRLYKPLCQLGHPRYSIVGQKPSRAGDVCVVGAAGRLDQRQLFAERGVSGLRSDILDLRRILFSMPSAKQITLSTKSDGRRRTAAGKTTALSAGAICATR